MPAGPGEWTFRISPATSPSRSASGRDRNAQGALTRNSLLTASIDQIMESGLHEYLEDFILANDKLASEITDGYRFYK